MKSQPAMICLPGTRGSRWNSILAASLLGNQIRSAGISSLVSDQERIQIGNGFGSDDKGPRFHIYYFAQRSGFQMLFHKVSDNGWSSRYA